MSICEKCGESVSIGDWPYCPHDSGNNLQQPMSPYTDDMIAGSPVEFRTIGEKVKYMDRHNLVPSRELGQRYPSANLRDSDIRHAIRDTIQDFRR